MNWYRLGKLIRHWLPLLVLGPILGGLAGYLVVQRIPFVYQATVTLLVQPGDALVNGIQDVQAAQDLAATYAEAIHTRRILADAAGQVGLDALSERELEDRVQARRVTGTELLRVTVEDTDNVRAADFANAVAQVFVRNNADAQASRFAASRDNLSQLIDQIQKDIDARVSAINNLDSQPASPERDSQKIQLENQLTQIRTTYGNTVKSYEDLRVTEARGANTATIFDPAIPPADPVRPNRTLTTLLAALSGLAVACGVVFLAAYLDDRLDSPSRVAARTGLATLGVLPNERATGSLRQTNGRSSLGSYRLLRSRLAVAIHQVGARSILVTSARVGEGKSAVAANLALALAEGGHKVILLDADLRTPAQMQLFELPNLSGLSSLLVAEHQPRVLPLNGTWSPSLEVLTAGPVPSDPSGLLSSNRLHGILHELRQQCDVLLVDAPALASEPDSLILSAHVDAVLLVVDARHTHGRAVARAVDTLRGASVHILGAIINRAGKDVAAFAASETIAAHNPAGADLISGGEAKVNIAGGS